MKETQGIPQQPTLDDTVDAASCRGCSAKIIWGVSPSGKRTPFDLKKTMVMMDGGEVIWAQVNHFITCPKADELRKKT